VDPPRPDGRPSGRRRRAFRRPRHSGRRIPAGLHLGLRRRFRADRGRCGVARALDLGRFRGASGCHQGRVEPFGGHGFRAALRRGPRPRRRARRGQRLPLQLRLAARAARGRRRAERRRARLLRPVAGRDAGARPGALAHALPLGPAERPPGPWRLAGARHRAALRRLRGAGRPPLRRPVAPRAGPERGGDPRDGGAREGLARARPRLARGVLRRGAPPQPRPGLGHAGVARGGAGDRARQRHVAAAGAARQARRGRGGRTPRCAVQPAVPRPALPRRPLPRDPGGGTGALAARGRRGAGRPAARPVGGELLRPGLRCRRRTLRRGAGRQPVPAARHPHGVHGGARKPRHAAAPPARRVRQPAGLDHGERRLLRGSGAGRGGGHPGPGAARLPARPPAGRVPRRRRGLRPSRLLLLDADGQLGVGQGLHPAVRPRRRGPRHGSARAEGEPGCFRGVGEGQSGGV
ncbi:MAG: GH1 / GH5_19, partial [uncultured Acetobacteraceae bacterium]